MAEFQIALPLVQYELAQEVIHQRVKDGYVNATAMCKAAGKLWADYNRLGTTGLYLQALSADMGIPISELVQSIRGGSPSLQGTWVGRVPRGGVGTVDPRQDRVRIRRPELAD